MRFDDDHYYFLDYGFDCDIVAVNMNFMVMVTREIRRLILCMMVMMQIMARLEGLMVIMIDCMLFILTSTFIVVGLIQVTIRVVSRTIIPIMVLIFSYRVHGYGGVDDGDTGCVCR